jgi:DNA-binding response OmpR family regulator
MEVPTGLMESELAVSRTDLHERLAAARKSLRQQSERLAALLEECRRTQLNGLLTLPDDVAPRLFANDVVRIGEAEILVPRQSVRHTGGTHRLTPTEWQLLAFLLASPGEVHSRLEMAAGAWGRGYADRNSEVEVYVSRLRRKLGPAGPLLETVRRRGYRLVLHPAAPSTNGHEHAVPAQLPA